MQPVSNDMDNLMRKAAEEYPLQAAGADWEKVLAELDKEDAGPLTTTAWLASRRYLLLALFLLASLVCNKYLYLHLGLTAQKLWYEKQPPEITAPAYKEAMQPDLNVINVGSINDKKAIVKIVSKSFYAEERQYTKLVQSEESRQQMQDEDGTKKWATVYQPKKFTSAAVDLNAMKMFQIPFVNAEPFIHNSPAAAQPAHTKTKETKHWYAGVIGGPDVSTVKFTKTTATGYSIGIVTGYAMGKRWAVETGLLWDRKNYYAEGKDFNTSKMNLPSHSSIIHAEGYCDMFEIPLNIRFNLGGGKSHNWFAAAGVSSYLMQKEEYDYLYERYNVQYHSNKYYTASSKSWLAAANISAGYAYKWGRGGTVRIEPYLKLPLRGAGIGNLPITSAGLHLGVTYPIK